MHETRAGDKGMGQVNWASAGDYGTRIWDKGMGQDRYKDMGQVHEERPWGRDM